MGFPVTKTSVLTRPANTTGYSIDDLIASNVTAGSIVVPSLSLGGFVSRLRLVTNHTTGLAAVAVVVRLWSTAPTYTNGDNGAYAVATGAAGFLGKFTGTFEQFADGAVAELALAVGAYVTLPAGVYTPEAGDLGGVALPVYWDVQTSTAFTPQSGKTFTCTAELVNGS